MAAAAVAAAVLGPLGSGGRARPRSGAHLRRGTAGYLPSCFHWARASASLAFGTPIWIWSEPSSAIGQ